ncbi:MAG: hypothetical protein IJ542_00335 [Clostridia bacterium]|nr:hypothetical protein [Clostridia bacterium]
MKKQGTIKFIIALFVVLTILGGIVCGGYFILDKIIVPKYFSSYGINNLGELVGMMKTLYNMPNESQIIVNGYSVDVDLPAAIEKLTSEEAHYPIKSDGTFDFDAFSEGKRGAGGISLTDRELASILDKLLGTTEFSDILPNLNHIDTINMNLPELSITPYVNEDQTVDKTHAHIKAILKIDTSEVRSQMSSEMNIPLFLLNMIFPKEFYITCVYDVEIDNSGEDSVWTTSNGSVAVNGSTAEQSKILLNLLISFIFNEEDNMTIPKLLDNFGGILERGTDLFGKIEFTNSITVGLKKHNGIYFLPVE